MKKLSILSVLAVGIISLVSCAKDRDCQCTEGGTTYTVTYNDVTKRQGKANCFDYTYNNQGGTQTKVTCELKK